MLWRSIPCIKSIGTLSLDLGLEKLDDDKKVFYRFVRFLLFFDEFDLVSLTSYLKSLVGKDGLKHESFFSKIKLLVSHSLLSS